MLKTTEDINHKWKEHFCKVLEGTEEERKAETQKQYVVVLKNIKPELIKKIAMERKAVRRIKYGKSHGIIHYIKKQVGSYTKT